MKLSLSNARVANEKINEYTLKLESYFSKLQEIHESKELMLAEGFLNVPFDESFIKQTLKLKKELVNEKLKYILVIGIGGSNLGTRAIYESLFGFFDEIEPNRFPKIIFLETTNSTHVSKILKFIKRIKNLDEIIINVVSKSGTTLETMANMELILGENPQLKDRLVLTTDEKSDLFEKALELEMNVLPIPCMVGGRFSAFTNVGLFPLTCAGINIEKILEGAREATKENLTNVGKSNAIKTSITFFENYKNGKTIHNFFVFEPELEYLGRWYEQLMAESLGKRGKGITPLTSIGSTDLHSEGQLDLGGPLDKIFTFVWTDYSGIQPRLPKKLLTEIVPEIKDKNMLSVERAILEASKKAYIKRGIPIIELEFEEISEKELAYFMQSKMIEIALLGTLMEVNPFNQPNVEEYKKEAKRILYDSN